MLRDRQTVAAATGLILVSSFGFGSLSTLAVLTMRGGLPLIPAMFWRYLLASGFLLIFLRRGIITGITRQGAARLFLVGGIGQAVITYLSLLALDYLSVGALAFLFYTYPAWVAIVAGITGRERLTSTRLVALALAMLGIAVMVGAPGSVSLSKFGVLLALGTALLYAFYLPALNFVQRGIPAAVSTFYLVLGVFTAFLVASIFGRGIIVPNTAELWRYLLLLSLVSTVLAVGTLVAGLRILGPVRTSIIATIEPFFTALLGVVFLGEQMNRNTILGGVLIAGAVLLLQRTAAASDALEAAT